MIAKAFIAMLVMSLCGCAFLTTHRHSFKLMLPDYNDPCTLDVWMKGERTLSMGYWSVVFDTCMFPIDGVVGIVYSVESVCDNSWSVDYGFLGSVLGLLPFISVVPYGDPAMRPDLMNAKKDGRLVDYIEKNEARFADLAIQGQGAQEMQEIWNEFFIHSPKIVRINMYVH